ncbi:MAG: hydrogenase 4 subunit B [Bryobacteraceae bacterium]
MIPAPESLFTAALIIFLAGATAGLLSGRRLFARTVTFGAALAGSLLDVFASTVALVRGATAVWALPFGVPMFTWTVRLDPLTCYFNLALGLLAAAVSLYSFGYLKPMVGRRNVGALGFFYNVLLASLALVFAAANAFSFLVAWEVMALSAFCLVSFEHEKTEARRAGILFLVMSHAGTGLLLIAFLVLGSAAGSLEFQAFHLLAPKLTPLASGVVFVLFFLGFGVKAGVVPVHIWLPDAHPVAPSNISAVMSGIVIKTGIYGMARVFFDFYGPPSLWMGALVLAIGVITALLGVLYALMEHDLKRLLAFHSIENIGIILMGFGAALLFRTLGHANLAALALIGSLYHTLNHAMFKGLLFLGAGAVLNSTGTRNMEEMGGLIRRMPATALFFLVGAVAISGLPPLNGFVSEWLTYQALLAGFGTTESLIRVMFPVAGALLALTAALAATCFVKAFGISFLALPRSDAAAKAPEAPLSMRISMGLLAVACIALGLGATWFLPVFDSITAQTFGVRMSAALVRANGLVISSGRDGGGTVSNVGILLTLVLLAGVPALLRYARRRREPRTANPVWDCGLPGLSAENEYTATAFSKPLRMIFSALYRPRREIQTEYDISRFYPTAVRFESEVEPAFRKRVYDPLKDWVLAAANRTRAVQAGSIHAYLAYIFVALLVLLLFEVRG